MRYDVYRDDETARSAMVLALHAEACERSRALASLLSALPAVGHPSNSVCRIRDRLQVLLGTNPVEPWGHAAALTAALQVADAALARRTTLEAWGKRVRNLRAEASLASARLRREALSCRRIMVGASLAATACAAGMVATISALPSLGGASMQVCLGVWLVAALVTCLVSDSSWARASRAMASARLSLADVEASVARELTRNDVLSPGAPTKT